MTSPAGLQAEPSAPASFSRGSAWDLAWVKVTVTFCGARTLLPEGLFVKGACIFLRNEQCLTVDVFWTPIFALSASEKANMKLQLLICLLAFEISQPWKYSAWVFYFGIGNISTNKHCFSNVKWILPFFPPCPMQLHPFFFSVVGFQLSSIRSASEWRPEDSRGETERSALLLETGDIGCGNTESSSFCIQFQSEKSL